LIKAVLFDLDDTLFDHRHAARCVLQELQSQHSILQMHPLEFLEQEDFRLLSEKHPLVIAGSIDVNEARIQRIHSLFACCGEEITREHARQVAECRQILYRQYRRAVPGAIELLSVLRRRVRIGIVTNNFVKEQEDKMEACGLTALVDVLVTSEEVQHAKPAPEIYHAALERLGCDASQASMVGDAWDTDIVGALQTGIRAVWFNRHGIAKPDVQDVVEIRSFEPPEVIAEIVTLHAEA
jgi:HAD superfamily hydrolase (TIGR01549 family)